MKLLIEISRNDCKFEIPPMNPEIIRTQRYQVGVVAFLLSALVFITQLGNRSLSVRILCSILGVICVIGVIRSSRSGVITLESNTIKIRTLYTSKTFEAEDIARVEARPILQITPRVIPVLIFRDGQEYRLSEFFVQLRTFRRSPKQNSVVRVVDSIDKWLKLFPFDSGLF